MPIYSVQGPDGRVYDVEGPAGASEDQILSFVSQNLSALTPEPKKKEGIGAALSKGTESLISQSRTGLAALLGKPEEAAKAGVERGEDIGRRYADMTSLDRVKKAYEERGLLPAAGEVASQIPSAISEQAPNIAATVASAKAGQAAGSVFGPAGRVIGGLGGAAVPSLLQQFGGNIERQAQEGKPINVGRAATAAVPQAALDVAGNFIPLGGRLVSKLTGIPEKALLAGGANAEKLANETLLKTIGKGTATGVAAEIPTEIAQQMLERAQAGLSLTSPDALKEYGETAYQVGLLGPMGIAGRSIDKGAARQEVAAKESEEKRKAQLEQMGLDEEAAAKKAAEEAAAEAHKQTPEYALDFGKKFDDLQAQFKGLKMAKPGADATFEEKDAYKEAQAKRKELGKQLAEMAPEYRRLKPVVAQAKEQARLAGMTPEEFMLEQQGLKVAEPTKVAPKQVINEFGQIVNEEKEKAAPNPVQDYAVQQVQAAKESGQLGLGDFADYLMQDPEMARQLVAQRPDLPGLNKADNNAVLTGVKLRLQDIEKEEQRKSKEELAQRQTDLQSQKLTEPKDELTRLKASQEQLDEQNKTAEPNFDYLDPMFEKALEGKPAVVAVNPDVRPSAQARQTRDRVDSLTKTLNEQEQKYYQAIRMNMATQAEQAYDASRTALDELNKLKEEGNPYAREVFAARKNQETALNEIEDTLDQIRSGATLGGAKTDVAASTAPLLARRAERTKGEYISAVLQEAATHRRAEGKQPLTQDEAIKAASKMNDVLTEWIDRVQAAPRRESLEEVVTQPAQMRGTEVVRGAKTELRDLRPLEKRRFGAYQEAVAVLKAQLDEVRDSLSKMPNNAVKETPLLKQQFATTEAQKVAEAKGETAKTLGGELRQHNEYVRDMMGKLDNSKITPRIQETLNAAADVMDSGKPTRALLNAVEEVVGRLNSGRKVEMSDLRAIKDAIAAIQETQAGQKSLDLLFEEPNKPARGIEKDVGFIRATPKNFENAPAVQKGRTPEKLRALADKKYEEEKAKREAQIKDLREKAVEERAKTRKAQEERDAAYKARNEAEAAAEAKRREETSVERRREESMQALEAQSERARQNQIKRLQAESLQEEIKDLKQEFNAIPGPKTGDELADLIAADGTKKAQRAAAMRKLELYTKLQALESQLEVLAEPKPVKKQAAATKKTETARGVETPLRTGNKEAKTPSEGTTKIGPVFRTATQAGAGMKAAEVTRLVDRIVKDWKITPQVVVVDDEKGLPQRIQDQAAKDDKVGKIPGLYDPSTNTVYMVASNLHTGEDVALTIAHEIAGHFGLREMLGDSYNRAMNNIYNGNETVRKQADAKMQSEPNLSREVAVEEVLAEMAETGAEPTPDTRNALRRLFDTIKNWFSRVLGTKTVSDDAVRQIVANARRYVQKGEGGLGGDVDTSGILYRTQPKYANPGLAAAGSVADKLVAKQKGVIENIRANSSGLAFETQLVDRFAGFERLAKLMEPLRGTQMMYYLRMYDQRMNFTAQSVGNGALQIVEKKRADGKTEYVIESKKGPSLKGVVDILKDAPAGSPDAANRLFTMYLAAKRAERVGLDKLNFNGRVSQADLNQAMKAIDNTPGLKENFERARMEYNAYNKGLINFLAQTGAISKEVAKSLSESNDYIPFYRQRGGVAELMIGGENPIRIGSIAEQPYLQELVGGDEPIIDFLTSSVQNTNILTDMGLRNIATKNAVLELVNLDLAKISKAKVSGPDVVKFKVDGEDRFALVDTDQVGVPADILVKGMEGIPTQMPFALRVLGAPARLLRKAVTATPLYAAKQLFRDSLAAPLISGADFTPVMGAIKEIGSAAKGTLESRGVTGGQVFTGTSEDLTNILRDITAGKSNWASLVSKFEAISMEADALTRRAQYNSYIKQGLSEMEATLMSLESMNFNKRGASPSVHIINSLIPFFNSQIQGLNVLYKAMTGKLPFNEKLKIQEKLMTRGMMLAAGTLAYTAMMQDDEAYKNATPEQKYGNWFVRLPGVDEPIRIPIPFEIGYIFKALPEALYNTMMDEHGGEDAAKAFANIIQNTIPGGSSYGIPQAMRPAIEAGLGKSFYTGRDIMSAHEKTLLPEDQFRANTTEIAKTVGKAAGVSPIAIEQLVQGYTGTMGLAFLQAVSMGVPRQEGPEGAYKRLSEMPVVGGAFQPNDAGAIINRVYDRMGEYKKVEASVNEAINKGDKARALELVNTRGNEYVAAEVADMYTSTMKDLTQMEQAIRASNMSPETQRKKLDDVRQAKIQFSRMVERSVDASKALP